MKTANNFVLAAFAGMATLLTAACDGDPTTATAIAGPGTLATKTAADAATCPAGGVVMKFGVDDNRDGVLQDSEVDVTVPVCNGAVGGTGAAGATGATGATGTAGATGATGATVASLVETTALPVGDTNCPAGGLAVKVGIDRNGNGTLDAGEFTTSYVCSGATGATGATGAAGAVGATGATGATGAVGAPGTAGATGATGAVGAPGTAGATGATGAVGAPGTAGATGATGTGTLISVTSEPASNGICATGGLKVQSGVDTNRNGTLDASEVTATNYVCGSGMPFFYKRVFVTSTVHAANFGGVAAGDAICNARAAAANLPGTYKAWLSDATTSPSTSFTRSTIGYALVDGTVIDTGSSRVFYPGSGVAQPLLAPIDKTETGGTPPATTGPGGTSLVWTGTDFRALTSTSGTCSDWTATSGVLGSVGDYRSTSFWTTAVSGGVCGGNKALYCFQQ